MAFLTEPSRPHAPEASALGQFMKRFINRLHQPEASATSFARPDGRCTVSRRLKSHFLPSWLCFLSESCSRAAFLTEPSRPHALEAAVLAIYETFHKSPASTGGIRHIVRAARWAVHGITQAKKSLVALLALLPLGFMLTRGVLDRTLSAARP